MLEKMQKVSDEPLKICENCGGKIGETMVALGVFNLRAKAGM